MINEEADMVNNVMHSLHIPEMLQNRVIDYYDHMLASMFVKKNDMYNLLSPNMSDLIKLYQIRMSVHDLSFINDKNSRQIENFVRNINIMFCLPGDVVIKQGQRNNRLFYIHEGIMEVGQHKEDIEYWIDPANINANTKNNSTLMDHLAFPKTKRESCKAVGGNFNGIKLNLVQGDEGESPFVSNQKNGSGSDIQKLGANKSNTRKLSLRKAFPEADKTIELFERKTKMEESKLHQSFASEGSLINNEIEEERLSISDHNSNHSITGIQPENHSFGKKNGKGSKVPESKTLNLKQHHILNSHEELPSPVSSFAKSAYIPQENSYKAINELSKSEYFGEVSIMTNLPVTATVQSISNSVLCYIKKEDFLTFVENFSDCKYNVEQRMMQYSDQYFRRLHKVVNNLPYLCKLSYESMRRLIFLMEKIKFNENQIVLHFKEYCDKFFIVLSGTVKVYTVNTETRQRVYFQKLQEGSCFNFTTCLLDYYSLFEFETEDHCEMMCLRKDQIMKMAEKNIVLSDIIEDLKANFTISGMKYDFSHHSVQKKPTQRLRSARPSRCVSSDEASPVKSFALKRKAAVNLDSNFLQTSQKKNALKAALLPIRILMKFSAFRTKLAEELK